MGGDRQARGRHRRPSRLFLYPTAVAVYSEVPRRLLTAFVAVVAMRLTPPPSAIGASQLRVFNQLISTQTMVGCCTAKVGAACDHMHVHFPFTSHTYRHGCRAASGGGGRRLLVATREKCALVGTERISKLRHISNAASFASSSEL